MGARLTAFENRATVDMEIRVFIPPDRPDRYRMIIRIKPGEVKKVLTKKLCNSEQNITAETENLIFLMVFMDGVYTGATLLPCEVKNYAKIIGCYESDSGVILKGVDAQGLAVSESSAAVSLFGETLRGNFAGITATLPNRAPSRF